MTDFPPVGTGARRRVALIALSMVGVVSITTLAVMPQYRALVVYGLYAIPSHLLISFLPHEPALFAAATVYPPRVVATVGVIACSVAIILDYWLIGWFVSRRLVKEQVDKSRVYEIAKRIFQKAPALLVAGSAFAPVPFYPVKILAIASNYSVVRFIIAMAIGRWPRFLLLAIGGQRVDPPNRLLLYVGIGLALLAIWQIRRVRRGRMSS